MAFSLFSAPLAPGTPAPNFALPDETGRSVVLSEMRGRNVVLIFYPGDDTPTCTRQLCDFRDHWDVARAHAIEIFGINPWSASSHERFRKKFSFPFPLLVDRGQHVARFYKAGGLFIRRTVYRIDPEGIIRFSSRGVPSPSVVIGL